MGHPPQPMDPNQQAMMQQNMQMQQQQMQQQNMAMQQQMMAQQQQLAVLNEELEYKSLDKKMDSFEHGIIVKQKMDLLEMLSGCERPNEYEVFRRKAGGGKKGKKEFKYKEKSTCYERQCMTGSCKPFRMKCINEQKVKDDDVCMFNEKECKCTCLCCNRQEMKCYYVEGESEKKYLGKCYDPWDCCNYSFKLYDDQGQIDYVVTGSCCQWYFFCKCPCESCQTVNFDVNEGETNNKVGDFTKHGRDCMSNALAGDDADIFVVDFPKGSNWRQRAMLMNLAVFVDYVMFEDTSDPKARGQ